MPTQTKRLNPVLTEAHLKSELARYTVLADSARARLRLMDSFTDGKVTGDDLPPDMRLQGGILNHLESIRSIITERLYPIDWSKISR